MLDYFLDALIDSLKLLPFLLLTYIVMELLEHKLSARSLTAVNRAGKFGPAIGGVLGIVPQCGFSAAVSNLYAGGIATRGTLIAVFLSTSDEMLPILISENVGVTLILKILAVKVVAAIFVGFMVDLAFKKKKSEHTIHDICEHEHCDCEHGIFRSAIIHTVQIYIFILIISFIMNIVIGLIGRENLSNIIMNRPVFGELIAGVVGLIPNCASSVVITQLFIQGGMSAGAMLSGLLAASGVGMLVLFRANHNLKDSLMILVITYISGVVLGTVIGLLPIF